MIDVSFLRQLDRLSLIINKKITSSYTGDRSTSFTGRGTIFKDRSMYAPGEDFRSIDWKAYGRTNKLYVKKYEAERNLTTHIILDFSASMKFGKKRSKADYASMMGVGFAYMALKNNERFVLSTFAEKLEHFKPKRGRRQLALIVKYLNDKKPAGQSRFEQSLARYKKLVNTKSFVVIVSDFLYPVEEIEDVLTRFDAHEIRLVQVLDPIEQDLHSLKGDFQVKDMETRSILSTFIGPVLKKKYKRKLEEHKAAVEKACERAGARFFSFTTDMPIFDAFYQVLRP